MSDKIAVIFCEARGSQNETHRDLLDSLAGRGDVEITVVPHLVDLAADGPVMQQLCEIEGGILVVSHLQSRAIHWLLAKNGLAGPFFELDPEDHTQQARPSQFKTEQGRVVWCLGIVGVDASDTVRVCKDCLDDISMQLGIISESSCNSEPRRIEETVSTRWYPVVDFDRCTNCLECLNFCLFGVYGLDESESLAIEQPDACRPGCPACSRICPEGAIMFPDHHDPAISGEPQASTGGLKLDLSQLFGGVEPSEMDHTALAAVERDRALSKKKADNQRSEQQPKDAVKKTNLDKLVDGIDEMEL